MVVSIKRGIDSPGLRFAGPHSLRLRKDGSIDFCNKEQRYLQSLGSGPQVLGRRKKSGRQCDSPLERGGGVCPSAS